MCGRAQATNVIATHTKRKWFFVRDVCVIIIIRYTKCQRTHIHHFRHKWLGYDIVPVQCLHVFIQPVQQQDEHIRLLPIQLWSLFVLYPSRPLFVIRIVTN